MLKTVRNFLIFNFLCLGLFEAKATHIVGGDFSLQKISGNQYELTLKVFRDCENGIPYFNQPLRVGIYEKSTNLLIQSVEMDLIEDDTLVFVGDNCINIPNGCTHVGTYRRRINLNPFSYNSPGGYYFVWERCCRNDIIKNIVTPGDMGMVYYMEIPPVTINNSSPVFNKPPLTLLCIDNPYTFDYGVTDADGDSLAFSLVTPLQGYTTPGSPNGNGTDLYAGPYPEVLWKPPFGLNNVIDGAPNLQIDNRTGTLTITPKSLGVYVVSVLCEEFRNGQKIGEIRREMQFTVTTCGNNANPKVAFAQSNNATYRVIASEELCFDITATDPNSTDSIVMTFSGDVLDQTKVFPAATVLPDSGIARADSRFCWQTSCDQAGLPPQTLRVEVNDNGCPFPKRAINYITIIVDPMPLVQPPDILCMELMNDQALNLYWGDTSSAEYFEYYLLFKGIDGKNNTVLDTIFDKSRRDYFDPETPDYSNINYTYFIRGVNKCGVWGPPSDTLGTFEQLIANPLPSDIIAVSVTEENAVSLSWSSNRDDDFSQYLIYKRKANSDEPFELIASRNSWLDTVFLDPDVLVNEQSYCYQLQVKDTCGNYSENSRSSCTIVLDGLSRPFEHELFWNPYTHWDEGVQLYELWRKDPATPYQKIAVINGPDLQKALDDKLNYNEGAYWYKVVAVENPSIHNATSTSNEKFLFQKPKLYVPSGFTPNGDGINEVWGHVPVFVKDYHMRVYTRWGEKIFESFDKLEQWEGNFDQPIHWDNAFVWVVSYTGWDGLSYYQSGTVTIIR